MCKFMDPIERRRRQPTWINTQGALMSKNDRFVVRHGSDWAVKKGGTEKPESVHRNQGRAEQVAKKTVSGLGGGEVRIQGRDGRWRDSDTVRPGRDAFPPRDKKH